jgi:Rho-binding antiterminator
MNDHKNPAGSDGYSPIACGLYSEYEVAILHRQTLCLHWRDDEGAGHIERIVPTDLQTRNHGEYLIAISTGGATLQIRLDRIVSRELETA